MNLHLLIPIHADMFYRQNWFLDQPFMLHSPVNTLQPPEGFVSRVVGRFDDEPSAIEYALLYTQFPDLPIWRKYLWTRDTDTKGQRVYVGGVTDTTGFQIHRHLHLTDQWGIAQWTT